MQLQPYYVLRRPLLPVGTYFQTQERLRHGAALPNVLRDVYRQPYVQTALFFASVDVHRQCQQWLAGGEEPSAKLLKTLYRYLVRMTTRATPFGLCSGISLGEWSEQSGAVFREQDAIRTHLRLDATAMQQVLQYVSQLPDVRPTVRYRSNTTTYAIGPDLRYVEATQYNGLPGHYTLSATDNTDYLHQILLAAREGLPLTDLIELLTRDGIDADEATTFIDHLIQNQLLQSEFDASLTVRDELDKLLVRIGDVPNLKAIHDLLSDVQTMLRTCNTAQQAVEAEHIGARLAPLVDIENRPLIQCDTYFPADRNTIGESVRQSLTQTLQRLLPLSQSGQTYLSTFQQRFYERFEEQAIPLLQALDPDVGIGYGGSSLATPLLDGLAWPGSDAADVRFAKRHGILLRLFTEAMRLEQPLIDLSEADLTELTKEQPEPTLPASGYWMGHLLAESADAIDAGTWQFYLMLGAGPSVGNLLGRMAHLDKTLMTYLQASLKQEEATASDAVWAEIVHLPEAKLANVLTRPVLRDYEIPILSVSGVDGDHQIPLDDLLISVPRGQRIVLRSRRLNKQVIPRLSTAHNFTLGLAHYRFLCDLQKQDGSLSLGWDWGPLSAQPHLPQVRYRNVILSRAVWHLIKADLAEPNWLAAWKKRYNVPRYVLISHADNELPLDLENSLNVDLLTEEVTKMGTISVKEWLTSERTCWVGDSTNRWVGELILPVSFSVNEQPVTEQVRHQHIDVPRVFAPGSEWLYLKIFSGEQASEQLLVTELPLLTEALREEGALQQWFYIRYNNPEPQLRVRFRATPGQESALLTQVLAWVQQLTAAHGTLYRVQLDTYLRELERYGVDRIEACERWFCLESEMLLPLLQHVSQTDETTRLFYACALVDRLLMAWQLPLDQRGALIERLRDSFSREFKADTNLLVQLDKSYRQHRAVVHGALTAFDAPPELTHYDTLFAQLADTLQRTLPDSTQRDELLASLLHMLLNRIFLTEQRRHEYLIYHLLRKEYLSIQKRK